jgi:hypothetical protein
MEATVIPLKSWQDPQGDILLIYSEHECSVFFGCWESSGEPADYICRLSFERASAVRSFRREYIPYRLPEHTAHSYILRVSNSDLHREHIEYRNRRYPNVGYSTSEHSHFVVVGHDIYHEILATQFAETTIRVSSLTDERLLALYRNA